MEIQPDRANKTLLVGLDAACWEYVEPLLAAGRMPALQRLMQTGIRGTLRSTMPPWTPAAWASIVTGKNPGKHGVFDMAWRRPNTYEFSPTNGNVRVGTPFWKRLNDIGLRVGLVNVPFTYPVEPLDGFVVAGFGTPASASEFTYPPDLRSWIEAKVGPFEPAVAAEFLQTAAPPDILDKETAHQALQVRLATELAERYEVDLLIINLMLTDHANHKMPELEQVQEAYCRADADLTYLLDHFRPDNVMLISDHGSSRVKGDFLLYEWLREQGYYVSEENTPTQRKAALNWLLHQWLKEQKGWTGLPEKVLRRIVGGGLEHLPAALQAWVWDRLEASFPFARDFVRYGNQPDYRRTAVFPGSAYAGLLYFNLAGREENGVVSVGEREALAVKIAGGLSELTDPDTGLPLFTRVFTREEIYSGPSAAHAPDLILDAYDSGWNIRSSPYAVLPNTVKAKYFVEATNEGRDFGWHSRDGLFVFSGPAFRSGAAVDSANLLDIPATLLYLHDAPIPEDFDGRALVELFQADVATRQQQYQPGDDELIATEDGAFSAAEAEEVRRHLRALGYMD